MALATLVLYFIATVELQHLGVLYLVIRFLERLAENI